MVLQKKINEINVDAALMDSVMNKLWSVHAHQVSREAIANLQNLKPKFSPTTFKIILKAWEIAVKLVQKLEYKQFLM